MTTSPYYDDGVVTLYLGSCMPLPDRPDIPVIDEWLTADVLVTDPPYGMGYQSNSAKAGPSKLIAGDDDPELRDRALGRWFADGRDRGALVFGTWRIPTPANVRQLIIWDKGESPGMGDLTLPWGPSHEDIYALGSSGHAGKRTGSVIRVPGYAAGSADRPNHPTPKPPALMEILVAKTEGVVAEPFAGSGATLLACRNLGRRVIGVELEEEYCELIATRLAQGAFDFGDIAAPVAAPTTRPARIPRAPVTFGTTSAFDFDGMTL